jgi:hypothetical protein
LREKGEIKDETITYIDAPTVVWEAIKWWQNIHNWLGDENESKEAKKYLLKIAPPLILPRQEIEKIITRDGFVHSLPKIKGEHPSLEYESAEKFIQRWNTIRSVFRDARSKKRYNRKKDLEIMYRDAYKAIQRLGNELYEDEVKLLDFSNISKTTISYIRLVHENLCPICKRKGLSNRTILRLYKKAEKEIKKRKEKKKSHPSLT